VVGIGSYEHNDGQHNVNILFCKKQLKDMIWDTT